MFPVMHCLSRSGHPSVSGPAAIRAIVLPAMLAVFSLGAPLAWATAAPTTTTLTVTSSGSTVTSVAAGTVVTLTATVVSGSAPVNPGQVNFCDATAKYCTDIHLLATAQVTTAGIATFKVRPGIGSQSYQAVFVGTSSYAKSTSTAADLTVTGLYPTTTTLAASGPIGDYTLTATVVGIGSHSLSPAGIVSFLDTTNSDALMGTAAAGTATPGETFTTLLGGNSPGTAAVGDFNGDGIPDLATISGSNKVTVLLGNGDGTFTTKSTTGVGISPSSIVMGDFNGDGIPDLATANCGASECNGGNTTGTVTVLLGKGDGTFTTKTITGIGNFPYAIAAGDFNRDGIQDLAIADFYGAAAILLGKGDGTFTIAPTPSTGANPFSIVVGDFNGDGIPDLAIGNQSGGLTVLLGNGDGTFTTLPSIGIGVFPSSIAVGDFNGDGFQDLAIPNVSGGTVTVLLGKGDGTFTIAPTPNMGAGPFSIVVGDFNGDGILDLAVGNIDDDTVTVLLGNGDGTFTTLSSVGIGVFPSSLAVGDFNRDGLEDTVVNGTVVLLNQITETATATLSSVSVSGTETHLVEASYPGDTNYNSSTSSTVTLLAAKSSTTLNLSSSAHPAPPGYQITLTATLNPSFLGSFTTDGDAVTFYNGGTSIGTGTLSSGVATLNILSLPNGANELTAVFAGDGNFLAATSNSLVETVATASGTIPIYVVTANTDDAAGVAANCTGPDSSSCSLRDALAAAAAAGSGDITFDPTAFGAAQSAAARTITLSNGTLNVPSNTTIDGLTAGVGTTLTNLVTVNTTRAAASANLRMPLFTVASNVTNAAIANLTISGAVLANIGAGAGISNHGVLTVTNSTISNNNAFLASGGGGFFNDGTLTIANSTVSGNEAYYNVGVGIYNVGMLTILNSTIAGNGVAGGGIYSTGMLAITSSTSADGLSAWGPTTLVNTLVSDCSGTGCPASGSHGNVVGGNALPGELGAYGGSTQTVPPLPGSAAICAGVPTGAATDQRGFPRGTTYGGSTCIDSGAFQTNYSLGFSTQPPASVPAGANFASSLQLKESGSPFRMSGVTIPLALGAGDPGPLNLTSLQTNSSGLAASSTLQVGAPANGNTLVSDLALTAPGVTPALSLTATSTSFNVTPANMEVTFAASAMGPAYIVDGVSYNAPVTLTWAVGSQHTLAAPSPQTAAGGQYVFASWSDGGAASHTVTASTATTSYTANFTATMYQLNVSVNPSSGGAVTPTSDLYYAPGTVINLIATPNAGYTFSGWTGASSGSIADPSQASTTITMSAPETITGTFATGQSSSFIVNTDSDDANGVPSNCTTSGGTCTLRDALGAAADFGVGNITFAPNVDGIGLGIGAGLYIPSNTTIIGPAGGLSVGGGPQYEAIFNVNPGVVNTAISNLSIGGNYTTTNGGGIYNGGQLTVTNSSIGGNNGQPFWGANGSGIFNDTGGDMTLINSNVSGNALNGPGTGTAGGIYNGGTMMVINSSISNNDVSCGGTSGGGCINFAGGIFNGGTLILTGSTIQGNEVDISGYGGGILNGGILVATNTNVTDNEFDGGPPGSETGEDDCDGGGCLANGVNGNTVGAPQPTQPAAAAAVFNPPAGNYGAPQPVTITDTTPAAILFYSTDGERTWTRYSGPVTVNSAETLQAIAVAANYTESLVSSAEYTIGSEPQISGISPNYGAPAAFVSIGGANFGATQGNGYVTVGGAISEVTSWSPTSITIRVPSRATTGNVVVTADGVSSNGVPFTFYPFPAITGFSTASAAVGSPVTIVGAGLLDGGNLATVAFNGIPATILSDSSTGIQVDVPEGAATGPVTVHVNGDTITSSTDFDVAGLPVPQVSGISPNYGAPAAFIAIAGTNFGATQSGGFVTIGGAPSEVVAWSNTGIMVRVPSRATTANVVVTAGGGSSNGASFTFYSEPSITGLSVNTGPVGKAVTIDGNNLLDGGNKATVTFNGTPAAISSDTSGNIQATVPTGATADPCSSRSMASPLPRQPSSPSRHHRRAVDQRHNVVDHLHRSTGIRSSCLITGLANATPYPASISEYGKSAIASLSQ